MCLLVGEECKGVKTVEFSEADLELLYDACVFNGGRLTAINKELIGCIEVAVKLEGKAKEAYQMALRIAKQMGDKE